jgi:hypothetical protein
MKIKNYFDPNFRLDGTPIKKQFIGLVELSDGSMMLPCLKLDKIFSFSDCGHLVTDDLYHNGSIYASTLKSFKTYGEIKTMIETLNKEEIYI